MLYWNDKKLFVAHHSFFKMISIPPQDYIIDGHKKMHKIVHSSYLSIFCTPTYVQYDNTQKNIFE